MKKRISMAICLVLIIGILAGCNAKTNSEDKSEHKLKIVTTIFPVYDWVREMVGENMDKVDLTMLVDNGVDLHSYKPTAEDVKKITDCDMLVYVGGESDEWIEDILEDNAKKDIKVVNLMKVMGDNAKTEEVVEGMEVSKHNHGHEGAEHHEDGDDHDHDGDAHHEDADDHDHDGHDEDMDEEHDHDHDEPELDEHVWLSLRNAKLLSNAIATELAALDSDNKQVYSENAVKFGRKLDALDKEYKEVVQNSKTKALVFGDRFPFRYLVDDYGIKYSAAFVGCSAETEASLNTIIFLSKKVDEQKLSSVMTIEGNNHGIAKTIVDNTKDKNAKILVLDSMQSTTGEDVKAGAKYIDIMQKNLEILKEALK